MEHLTHKIDNYWLDNPTPTLESKEVSMWKQDLTDKDNVFFQQMISNITLAGDYVKYMGKTKKVRDNVYNSILNEETFSPVKKKKWTSYVMDKFKSIDNFNKLCEEHKRIAIFRDDINKICFYKESPKFNLLVSNDDMLNRKVYVKPNYDNKQVRLLCTLNDTDAKKKIFNYIKLSLNLECLRGVKSEIKIYEAFMEEISLGYHCDYINPVVVSNNPNTYCLSYVDLNFQNTQPTPAWDNFVNQFETVEMKSKFMKWIYSIFVENDFDRRVLWIEGMAQTLKTTTVNIIAGQLQSYNHNLVGALPKIEDKFSLAGIHNARLVIYSDANDTNFFKRKDVLNLTGNDIVYYEEKNKNQEAKKLYAKIIVTSNYPPCINKKNSFETSRLLHIKINDNKAKKASKSITNIPFMEYKKMLKDELISFLAKCKQLYKE